MTYSLSIKGCNDDEDEGDNDDDDGGDNAIVLALLCTARNILHQIFFINALSNNSANSIQVSHLNVYLPFEPNIFPS